MSKKVTSERFSCRSRLRFPLFGSELVILRVSVVGLTPLVVVRRPGLELIGWLLEHQSFPFQGPLQSQTCRQGSLQMAHSPLSAVSHGANNDVFHQARQLRSCTTNVCLTCWTVKASRSRFHFVHSATSPLWETLDAFIILTLQICRA